MDLRMAVGKREAAGLVVVASRKIDPLRRLHAERERGIVEAFGVFIEQHPERRRSGRADL